MSRFKNSTHHAHCEKNVIKKYLRIFCSRLSNSWQILGKFLAIVKLVSSAMTSPPPMGAQWRKLSPPTDSRWDRRVNKEGGVRYIGYRVVKVLGGRAECAQRPSALVSGRRGAGRRGLWSPNPDPNRSRNAARPQGAHPPPSSFTTPRHA